MSASTMVEVLDMPMIDYSEDGDIPMAGSSENWPQPLSHMDEDVHHVGPSSQEVDMMMAYEEVTTEYDMEDDAAQLQGATPDANVVDAEVYDATIHSSPPPPAPTEIGETLNVQSAALVTAEAFVKHAHADEGQQLTVTHDSEPLMTRNFAAPDATQTRDTLPVASDALYPDYPSDPEGSEHAHEHQLAVPEHIVGLSSAPPQASGEVADNVDGYTAALSEHPATPLLLEGAERHPDNEQDDRPPDPSSDAYSELTLEHQEVTGSEYPETNEADEEAFREPRAEEANGDAINSPAGQYQLYSNQQAYTQPPPPIMLSLQVTSTEGDQPDFVLFNLPESSSHAAEEPLLLLQHRPSLFYEPISTVFEAFRQEEYFSHLEELSEAEMALNAHDLQLVISEDNVYAREVSLHDLHAMHLGVGLPGHLRLMLQSVVPRFIVRYNVLRDQITRLVLSDESEEAQQHVENAVEEEEGGSGSLLSDVDSNTPSPGHETQGQTESALQGDVVHEAQDEHAAKQGEDAEGVEEVRGEDDRDKLQHTEDASTEAGAEDSAEGDTDEAGHGAASDVLEHGDNEHEEQKAHNVDDVELEENDNTADVLEADSLHPNAQEDDAESAPGEHVADYTDVTEPHEEGEDGYGVNFKEDGADSIGTIGEADVSATPAGGDGSNADANEEQDPVPELDIPQSAVISQSASASSFDTDDTSWVDEAEEVDDLVDTKQGADHSEQQTAANIFDEEGNLADGVEDGFDEFGDDQFGGDDFDESAEGTVDEEIQKLDGIANASQEQESEADAASRAVLAESEKFVSELENDGDNLGKASEEATKIGIRTKEDLEFRRSKHSSVIEITSEKPTMVHQNRSKRSLDDIKFDDEFVSPPSSPDSKRTRTL